MTKVAVIGCGPGGMFFLHAVALRRKRLEAEGGNAAAIAALPDVTCFERSSDPGGVWRSDGRRNKEGDDNESTTTRMYEALWTNGPKECIEFFDYTFDDHFGSALPVYVPRALVLEYVTARCTKDNPRFFDNVKFDTTVESVNFDDDLGKFVVKTTDNESKRVTESVFDKCIWAGGGNGKPNIPRDIAKTLTSGGYKGTAMHSSETGPNFEKLVRGKKVLIIGDNYSAEDLALQAIKLGVRNIDMCSRHGMGAAYWTGAWPMDKVRIHYAHAPIGVADDGLGVVLGDGTNRMVLDEVDTVIYCTGYLKNMDMLHPSLRPNFVGPFFAEYDIPTDWKMPENSLSKEFGDIPIGKIISPPFVHHDIYRGRLMSNPNMMFFLERTDVPMADLDVTAWLLLAQTTGDLPLPSAKEMKRFNLESLLEAMKDPYVRNYKDENYKDRWWSVDPTHWSYKMSDKRMVRMTKNYLDLEFRILARDMLDAKYPLQIGTYEKLNERGNALVEFNKACGYDRYGLATDSKDALWRTFRDGNPSVCYSIMTGTLAVPLKRRWLDLEGHTMDDIVDESAKRMEKVPSVTRRIRV